MSDELALRHLAKPAPKPEINPTGEEAPDNSVYDSSGFIHLRDVEFFSPGGENKTPMRGVVPYWRGRLSAIDGFFLGTLEPAPELGVDSPN